MINLNFTLVRVIALRSFRLILSPYDSRTIYAGIREP